LFVELKFKKPVHLMHRLFVYLDGEINGLSQEPPTKKCKFSVSGFCGSVTAGSGAGVSPV
jgi:hypothetical protein